jgi:hypothetical protein
MSEILHVKDVEALDGYVIRVTFSDDAIKEVDLGDMLERARGVFVPLRDPRVFSEVRVNDLTGTVEWPGEVDFDSEVLYGLFEPASSRPLQRRTVREPVRAGH